jgi:hypothetical protein
MFRPDETDLDPFSLVLTGDPTVLDPAQFTVPTIIRSDSVKSQLSEEQEGNLLLVISVVGVGAGIIVGWLGATRR